MKKKKIGEVSASTHPPSPTPDLPIHYISTTFLIFQIPPPREVIKIYSPSFNSFKKGGEGGGGGQSYGRYCLGRYSSKLAQLVPLLFLWGRSSHYSDRLYNFSVSIPRWYKHVYANRFFARTARLWNSLPRELKWSAWLRFENKMFKVKLNLL